MVTKFGKEFISVLHFFPEKSVTSGMSRESLKVLCELASSEKDRRLIHVAASHGQTGSHAQKFMGISNFHAERERVKIAIREYEEIKAAINQIAQDALSSFVSTVSSDSSDSELSIDSDGESCEWNSGSEETNDIKASSVKVSSETETQIPWWVKV